MKNFRCRPALITMMVLSLFAVLLLSGTASAEATDEEIMARLTGYGYQVNETLELGASDISWQYVTPTDDPSCWLISVGTTDNGKTIVLAQGNRILDNQVHLYGVWTDRKSHKAADPEMIGNACLFWDNITAWAFDGTVTDGSVIVNVKKAWGWFEDGTLISGNLHYKGSNWIDLGCGHRYNRSTHELRAKAIHSYLLKGGYPASCYKTGLAVYECSRCGKGLTVTRPLSHKTVTYNGIGTFCVKCGQKIR